MTSVYVHVPFCRGRCPYCDFASNDIASPPWREYGDAIGAEWRRRSRESAEPLAVDTLYIGGGTPSLTSAPWILKIIETLDPAPGAEVTVEANPGDVDALWYDSLARAGVTRFSIGAQAADAGRLAWLGRRHGVSDVFEALGVARRSGAASVSADLIYGTPGSTAEAMAQEVAALVDGGADHISAYELTIAPGTPFGARKMRGELDALEEELLVASWDAIGEALAGLGFARYEVSSYARAGRRCRHNENYWRGGAYVGLGAGAHGHVIAGATRFRYANATDLKQYMDAALGDSTAISGGLGSSAMIDVVNDEGAAQELVALGLRWSEGVDLEAVARLLPAEGARLEAFVSARVREGNAVRAANRLVPTREGMLFADGLAERF